MSDRMGDDETVGGGEIEIRLLQDDAAAIELGLRAGLEHTEGEEEGLVARWGAFSDGELVGTIALRRTHGMAVVSWMAVDEQHRGRGIGRGLLDVLEDEAAARGLDRLWVAARAPGFYWANGFQPVGRGEEADYLLGGCLDCAQYGVECRPEAATKALGDR